MPPIHESAAPPPRRRAVHGAVRRAVRRAAALLFTAVVTAALTACSSGEPSAASSTATSAASASSVGTGAAATPSSLGSAGTGLPQEQAVQLIRGHLEAVGRADADAWTAPLDPNVRFDIAGSIYQGREAARGWAERDPIGQRGRYDILSLTPTATGVTADVTFRAGSLVEQIRYQYTIRGGKIIDLVARYRQ